jgi:hypothetical protein
VANLADVQDGGKYRCESCHSARDAPLG